MNCTEELENNQDTKHDLSTNTMASMDIEVTAHNVEKENPDIDNVSNNPIPETHDNMTPPQLANDDLIQPDDVDVVEENVIHSFAQLGLKSQLIEAVKNLRWESPTPVQYLSLPHSLKGRDVAGFAQTGTGKTGAFLLTLGQVALELQGKEKRKETRNPFAVVLSPTRELAIQIEEECRRLLSHLNIVSAAIYGGTNWEGQAKQLQQDVDIIIATPGRLKDYHDKNMISLDEVKLFICDEADRMFDMGFIDDVEFFLSKIDTKAQKLVFSATTNERVNELVFQYLNSPEYISVSPKEITPENIVQHALICETKHKFKLLLWLLEQHKPEIAMIFTNTKLTAQWLHYKLCGNSIEADIITGDLPQTKRSKLLTKIKEGKTKILIATDVASRGIHISGISHVYNFDIPDEAANYVHRIGRTARAGAKGESYSLVCDEYASNFLGVQEILGKNCPQSIWPDDSYLSVEDKAGNPFEDESSSLHKDFRDKNKKPERRDNNTGRRFEGGKAKNQSRDSNWQSRDNSFRKNRGKKPPYDRNQKRPSSGNMKKHKIQAAKPKPTVQKRTLMGMIKRFFKLLFKRKNDKNN